MGHLCFRYHRSDGNFLHASCLGWRRATGKIDGRDGRKQFPSKPSSGFSGTRDQGCLRLNIPRLYFRTDKIYAPNLKHQRKLQLLLVLNTVSKKVAQFFIREGSTGVISKSCTLVHVGLRDHRLAIKPDLRPWDLHPPKRNQRGKNK